MNLCHPSVLKEILNRHGFSFSKSLGQNFLIDENVLNKILSASDIGEDSCVLEIGPGAGTLTRCLAGTGATCVAVEIDKALLPILEETTGEFENFTLINNDILKVDLSELAETARSTHLVLTTLKCTVSFPTAHTPLPISSAALHHGLQIPLLYRSLF